jgi:hypothetical protein
MACILVVLFAVHSIHLTTYSIYTIVNSQTVQTGCTQLSSTVNIVINFLPIFFRVLIPLGIMVVLDSFVMVHLRKSKKNAVLNTDLAKGQHKGHMTLREIKFYTSTIVIDFIFLTFYMPEAVAFTMTEVNLFQTTSSIATTGTVENAIFNFFVNVAHLVSYGYIIVVVFVSFACNRLFRKEFKRIFRSFLFRNRVQPPSGLSHSTFRHTHNMNLRSTILK